MLSLKIVIGSLAKSMTLRFWNNLPNQTTSYTVTKQVTYYDSMVDKAMQDCFLLRQVIIVSLSKKAYLIVDLHSSLSLVQSTLQCLLNLQVPILIAEDKISSPFEVTKNLLSCSPLNRAQVTLVMTNQSNYKTYVKSSTQHSIYQASNCTRIKNSCQLFPFLIILRALIKTRGVTFLNRCVNRFAILHPKLVQNFLNISLLKQTKKCS